MDLKWKSQRENEEKYLIGIIKCNGRFVQQYIRIEWSTREWDAIFRARYKIREGADYRLCFNAKTFNTFSTKMLLSL